ncbi:MAG: hypothetical protein IPJ00_21385 [Saprospirales bacterium]|nr:hypothetical protein [Saprospirales bacterium]
MINQTLGGAFMASVLILIYSGILWFVLHSSFRNITGSDCRLADVPFLKEYPGRYGKWQGK